MTEQIFMKIAPKGSDGEGGPIRNCIFNQVYVYETHTLNVSSKSHAVVDFVFIPYEHLTLMRGYFST